MTGLDRNQTPKTRPMPQKRTALVASLDIGTSKIDECICAREHLGQSAIACMRIPMHVAQYSFGSPTALRVCTRQNGDGMPICNK